ncbi:MAG: D-cysteine desulfhydrase family protein [Phycisphaerales bacterium]|nr:D-cysteine desulfhydrase family protein [Phycisphaerales bacterium]
MNTPERIRLANLPTPLHRLDRLSESLDADIWIKRDDLTGLELSGNKVRKLEFVLADARRAGCDTIITEGTCQSNHCRATAAACARLGMQAVLLFRPLPPAGVAGNQLLDSLFGAQTMAFSREDLSANKNAILSRLSAELKREGRRPRFTPAGASEPLGCWGYIEAARELRDQLHAANIRKCDIVLAVSSCGTAAGLHLGKLLCGCGDWSIWNVPVSDDVEHHRREISRLCSESIEQFALPIKTSAEDIAFIDGYVGEGYAIPYQQAIDGLRLLARIEAILLDPVYTAKAFCALLEMVRAGNLGKERPVVFLHTGGIFSNFAWPDVIL